MCIFLDLLAEDGVLHINLSKLEKVGPNALMEETNLEQLEGRF